MPKKKLSDADVAGIRYARAEGASYREIAKIYRVSSTQIYRIVNRQQRKKTGTDKG